MTVRIDTVLCRNRPDAQARQTAPAWPRPSPEAPSELAGIVSGGLGTPQHSYRKQLQEVRKVERAYIVRQSASSESKHDSEESKVVWVVASTHARHVCTRSAPREKDAS